MKTGYAMVASRLSAWFTRYGHEVDVITEGRGCYRIGKVAFLDETGRKMFDRDHDIVQIIGPTPFFSEQCVTVAKKQDLPSCVHDERFPRSFLLLSQSHVGLGRYAVQEIQPLPENSRRRPRGLPHQRFCTV